MRVDDGSVIDTHATCGRLVPGCRTLGASCSNNGLSVTPRTYEFVLYAVKHREVCDFILKLYALNIQFKIVEDLVFQHVH